MNIKCNECGFPLSGEENICPECGNPIMESKEKIKGESADLRLHDDFARFYQGFFLFRAIYLENLTSSSDDASRINVINEILLAANILIRFILWASLMLIPISILFCTIIFIPFSILLFKSWLEKLLNKYWIPVYKLHLRLNQRYWISMYQSVKSNSLEV